MPRVPWPWEQPVKCTTCNDTGIVPIMDCDDCEDCVTSCWDECPAGQAFERGIL